MIKPDEADLRIAVMDNGGRLPDHIWEEITRRQLGILSKWERKGWWDCGVSLRTGWLTEAGKKALAEWRAVEAQP